MPVTNPFLQPIKSAADYQNDYAAADARRNQNALQGATLQDATDARNRAAAFRSTIARGGDLADQGFQNQLYAADPTLAGQAITTYQTGVEKGAKAKKDIADAGKTTQDTQIAAHTQHLQALAGVNSPEDALAWLAEGVRNGSMTPDQFQNGISKLHNMTSQEQFAQWKNQNQMGGIALLEQMGMTAAKPTEVRLGNVVKMIDTNPRSQTFGKEVVQAQPIGISPDTVANNETSRANTAATQAGEDRRAASSRATQLTVAGIDPNNPNGSSAGALSPAAVENAAARYNVDGTLPAMAMGPRGSVGRTAILNRAAELAIGTDPTQLRVNQMDAKSAGSALTQLTKAKTMSAAFEDTANQNADLALSLSKKNDRTGIPLLNAGLQAWRTGTGSPEATQFAAANETFVNEYAKIMSGGMGNGPVSDAARNKAHSLLTTGMTDGQYEGNVRLLQKEMRNRMKGFDDQETALKTRMGGKADPSSGAQGTHPPDITALIDKYGKK